MNTRRLFRPRKSLQLAATLAVVAAVSLLSSAGLRGAMRDTPVSDWVPKLARLALMPVASFMQGPVAGQGDGRTVPGAQAKPGAPAVPPTGDGMVSLLVKTAPGLSDEDADALVTRAGGKRGRGIGRLRLHVVRVPQAALDGVLHRFKEDPGVERVEVEQQRKIAQDVVPAVPPTDPAHADQWALETIRWNASWSSVPQAGSARIAVIDTGVSAAAGELNVADGFSAFGTDPRSDPNGHGTWVASIAAAVGNNGTGMAGVSFANTTVLPVQVLDANGQGQDSDIINGVLWAVENSADVILMAFSNPGYSQSLQDAIDLAWANGIVIVAATGNEASSTPTFPAGDAKVVGVAATDQTDALWAQSNFGKAAFLAAPGVAISGLRADGSLLSTSGTSASSAIVAGAAALLKIADPSLSNGAIVGRLARNADVAGTQEQTGNGRINIERALADTSSEEVVPVGAPPEGDGGPFVGPYLIADKGLTITFAGSGSGTVAFSNLDPSRTVPACTGNPCAPQLHNDQLGTLTITPNNGSTFAGWTGAFVPGGATTCTGTATSCTFSMANKAQALTVTFNGKSNQTITFPQPSTPAAFGSTFVVAPTSTSNLQVTVSASGGCSITGFTVTMTSSTTVCELTATQPGDTSFNAATPVVRTVSATKATQVAVTVSVPATAVYQQSGLSAVASGGSGTGSYSYSHGASTACSVNSSTGALSITSGSGTCSITATRAADADYLASDPSAPASVIVGKASQTITFAAPASPATYQSTFGVAPTASSGLAVTVVASGTCSLSGNTVTITSGTGDCTLTASQAGDGNYSAATDVVRTVAAAKKAQTITFGAPASPAVYQSTFAVVPSADSMLTVAVVATGACSVSGGMVTMTSGTGDCTLRANQPGDANYGAAAEVVHVVAAAKAKATITVTPYSVTFDGQPHTATGTASGNGVDLSSLLDLTGTTHTNAGTYASDAWTFAGDSNYEADSGTASNVISKADATVNVTGYTGVYDGAVHGATGSATGVGGVALTGLDLGASFTNVPGGTANWTFTDATGNYNNASGTATIVISKADATVTVTGYTGAYDGAAHGATGSSTGVGGVALTGLDLGASFTNVPGGTANWTFTDATGNYNNATGTATIVITKADATVTVTGYTGVYDGAAHGATGTATGVGGAPLAGLVLGDSFTNVPGGTANWTFTDTTGNYNNATGTAAIVIGKANASVVVSGYTGVFDGAAHGATGTASGVGGAALSGLSLGGSFTNVPGGTATWTFTDTTGNYNNASGSVNIVISPAPVTATAGSGVSNYDALPKSPSPCLVTGTYTGTVVCTNIPSIVGPSVSVTTITPAVSAGGGLLANYAITGVNGVYIINDVLAPATVNVAVNPNPVQIDTGFKVTATIDDTDDDVTLRGNSFIAKAEYRINDSVWTPMTAVAPATFGTAAVLNVEATVNGMSSAVYQVCVRGTDVHGNVSDPTCTLLAIFDPSGGFVTGGGFIDSPIGASVTFPMAVGRANFGFVSKYQKGAKIPTGETEFQFKAGNLNFHSSLYEWLVVAGARAQYKGEGTINGTGRYGFLLTAIDGQTTGGGGADRFRIKIWDFTSGVVVYDNQLGQPDEGDASTALSGGSIVIHQPPAGKK